MKRLIAQLAAAIGFTCFAGIANASLIGDEIIVRANGDAGVTCTVGTNCDGQGAIGFDNLIVGAESISIDVQQWLGGYTLEFRDLDWVGVVNGILTGVNLSSVGCCYGGGGEPLVSNITDHGFDLSYFHLVADQGEIIVMDLITSHNVPAPATVLLLGLGMLGLGWNRSRKS